MKFDMAMLAYCGIYCEQCSVRTAAMEQNVMHIEHFPAKFNVDPSNLSEYACEGCKGRNLCGPCKIKDCAVAKGLESCASCANFPCSSIDAFGNDDIPHHHEAIENLKKIRSAGLASWFENMSRKLRCHCGERLSWYHACPNHP